MNREIKFRAWDKVKKEMWEPREIGWGHKGEQGKSPLVERWKGSTRLAFIHGDDCELMQFIGLKDKNGKDIYEGDIVKLSSNGESDVAAVEWCEGGCSFDLDRTVSAGRYGGHDLQFLIGSVESIEVIGNIYENLELLKSADPAPADDDNDYCDMSGATPGDR